MISLKTRVLTDMSIVDRLWLSIKDRQIGGSYMVEYKLGIVESHFADIVWAHEPMSTSELVKLCEAELNWKRTTTYTVLKKLGEKGIFQLQDGTVTSLISREDYYAAQSEKFVSETFDGSLPAFFAAFTKRKSISQKDLEEIRRMIDSFEEG